VGENVDSESVWEKKIRTQPPERVIGCIITQREELVKEASETVEYIGSKMSLSKGMKVLDIGTGPLARNAIEFAKRGCDVEAVDVSRTTLKFAKENYERHKESCKGKITFSQSNANKLEFKDDSFDVVLFLGVLYHIPKNELGDCVSEISRVLKPKGRCVTDFACKHYPIHFQGMAYRKLHEVFKGRHPVEFVFYSYKEIMELFGKNQMSLFSSKSRSDPGCMLFGHPKTVRFKPIGDALTYPIALLFRKLPMLQNYQGNYFLIFDSTKAP